MFDHFLKVLLEVFFVNLTIRFTITEYKPKFAENCCAHKILHKCSSNYYHLFIIVTFIFENRLFFADFFSLSNDACYRYVMTNTPIKYILINENIML